MVSAVLSLDVRCMSVSIDLSIGEGHAKERQRRESICSATTADTSGVRRRRGFEARVHGVYGCIELTLSVLWLTRNPAAKAEPSYQQNGFVKFDLGFAKLLFLRQAMAKPPKAKRDRIVLHDFLRTASSKKPVCVVGKSIQRRKDQGRCLVPLEAEERYREFDHEREDGWCC